MLIDSSEENQNELDIDAELGELARDEAYSYQQKGGDASGEELNEGST